MPEYVQYDEAGNVTATVRSPAPPDHPRQAEAAAPLGNPREFRVNPLTKAVRKKTKAELATEDAAAELSVSAEPVKG